MDKEDRKFVKSNIIGELGMLLFDGSDCETIADSILDDVVTDIEETADEKLWNSSDVNISMKRVLMKRILFNN